MDLREIKGKYPHERQTKSVGAESLINIDEKRRKIKREKLKMDKDGSKKESKDTREKGDVTSSIKIEGMDDKQVKEREKVIEESKKDVSSKDEIDEEKDLQDNNDVVMYATIICLGAISIPGDDKNEMKQKYLVEKTSDSKVLDRDLLKAQDKEKESVTVFLERVLEKEMTLERNGILVYERVKNIPSVVNILEEFLKVKIVKEYGVVPNVISDKVKKKTLMKVVKLRPEDTFSPSEWLKQNNYEEMYKTFIEKMKDVWPTTVLNISSIEDIPNNVMYILSRIDFSELGAGIANMVVNEHTQEKESGEKIKIRVGTMKQDGEYESVKTKDGKEIKVIKSGYKDLDMVDKLRQVVFKENDNQLIGRVKTSVGGNIYFLLPTDENNDNLYMKLNDQIIQGFNKTKPSFYKFLIADSGQKKKNIETEKEQIDDDKKEKDEDSVVKQKRKRRKKKDKK